MKELTSKALRSIFDLRTLAVEQRENVVLSGTTPPLAR
jgi:hypothetical protein